MLEHQLAVFYQIIPQGPIGRIRETAYQAERQTQSIGPCGIPSLVAAIKNCPRLPCYADMHAQSQM
jgi:hypothetical protein